MWILNAERVTNKRSKKRKNTLKPKHKTITKTEIGCFHRTEGAVGLLRDGNDTNWSESCEEPSQQRLKSSDTFIMFFHFLFFLNLYALFAMYNFSCSWRCCRCRFPSQHFMFHFHFVCCSQTWLVSPTFWYTSNGSVYRVQSSIYAIYIFFPYFNLLSFLCASHFSL